jgi:hypothetical protein
MRQASLWAAVGVILIANAAALIHAARNRSGAPEAEVTLTQSELNYFHRDADDSGVELRLRWVELDNMWGPRWLNEQMLRDLGFDCSVKSPQEAAEEFYARQLPRSAYVAMEYNGPAFQTWLAQDRLRTVRVENPVKLLPIDASLDPAALRSRHPDRHSVIIVPAIIQIRFVGPPRFVAGMIEQVPVEIHVPRPLSEEFRGLPVNAQYSVHLRYGRFLEPWVTGVEFAAK